MCCADDAEAAGFTLNEQALVPLTQKSHIAPINVYLALIALPFRVHVLVLVQYLHNDTVFVIFHGKKYDKTTIHKKSCKLRGG